MSLAIYLLLSRLWHLDWICLISVVTSQRQILLPFQFSCQKTGLPDGIFSKQKSRFWSILEGLAMEGVGIPTYYVYVNLVYFMVIWSIFYPFWYVVPTKSGNPASQTYTYVRIYSSMRWCNVRQWQDCQIFLGTIYTNAGRTIPNAHEMYQMAVKYTSTFHSKALQNIHKLIYLECKYAIRQPST
jgi:hypothetical protein